MEDHRIGDMLRELPRERARAGFTARVLERLDTPDAGRPVLRWQTAAVLAAAALVAVAVPISLLRAPESGSAQEAQRVLEELRAEHGRLEQELREISEPPPVLYLGGSEDVDLVLDVSRVPEAGQAMPAAYRNDTF